MLLRILSFVILIAGLFFNLTMLTGCGNTKGNGNKITISVACCYSPTDVGCRVIDKSLDDFMKKNPDIKIKKIWISNANDYYWTKLLTMIAGGNPPDVFRMGPDFIPVYARKGVLMPLDDFVGKSKVLKLDDFFPQCLLKYKFDVRTNTVGTGSIYGFGTDWSPDYTLFFNKNMFDKAGLSYPDRSLDWEEFRKIANKLTVHQKGKSQFGCLLRDVTILVYQNGGQVFSKDGKKCLLDSPDSIEAFQFLVNLRMKDKVMPSLTELRDTNQLQLFQMGRLGMFLSGRYYAPLLTNLVKDFSWGVAPGLHQKKRVNVVTGPFGWVMSSKSGNKVAAWKLIEHLAAGDCEKQLAREGYNIPVIKGIAYSDLFLNNPSHPPGLNKVFLDEVKYTVPSQLTPYVPFDRWQRIILDELDLAYMGKQTAKQAAINATKKIDVVIKEALNE